MRMRAGGPTCSFATFRARDKREQGGSAALLAIRGLALRALGSRLSVPFHYLLIG